MSLLDRAPSPAREQPAALVDPKHGTVLPRHAAPRPVRLPGRRGLVVLAVVATVIALLASVLVVAGRARATTHLLLSVDGTPTTVTSGAATVGELLREQGITTSGRDAVHPAPATELADVDEVSVGYARPVVLTLDGVTSAAWTTEPDVGSLLRSLGVPPSSYASASPLQPLPRVGATLTVRTPRAVTVTVDGSTVPLVTTAATVGQALADPTVGYRAGDRLSVPAGTPVRAGAAYRVVRVESDEQVRRMVLRADTSWVRRASIPAGTSQVLAQGRDGVRERRVRVRYEDGRVTTRTVLSDKVVSRPVHWVIAIGTGRAATGSPVEVSHPRRWTPATGKVDGAPDFAALARCESGGNPRAVNPTGKYRGLYQFDLTTWRGVGGTGDPIDASPAEQTRRARILYQDRGRAPWPYCGRFL